MKLTGISEVMIICMGSSFSYQRIGHSSSWTNSTTGVVIGTAQVAENVELYLQGGKSTIIPVQFTEPAEKEGEQEKPFFSTASGMSFANAYLMDSVGNKTPLFSFKANKVEVQLAGVIPEEAEEIQIFRIYDDIEISGGTFWRHPFEERGSGREWRRMERNSFGIWFEAGRWSNLQLAKRIATERPQGWEVRIYDKSGTRIDQQNNKEL